MDKFLEQFKTAVENAPEPVYPKGAWSKFLAYRQAVAPSPVTSLSLPHFMAAASVTVAVISAFLYWFFEPSKIEPAQPIASEIHCPCFKEINQIQAGLKPANFYTLFPKPSSSDALTMTKPSASNLKTASKTQKTVHAGHANRPHSKSNQPSYGHEFLTSRPIEVQNQSLETVLQDSNRVIQNASNLLTTLSCQDLSFEFEKMENKPFDSLNFQVLELQKRRRLGLNLEAAAATTLIQAESDMPRLNNLMVGLGLKLSRKFRLKTNLSLNYIRNKVKPTNSHLPNLNPIQRYRLKSTAIEGQSIQIISQIEYMPFRWKAIAPFIGVGGGLNILENKELKHEFKSLNLTFLKYAKEETELAPFLITLQAGVDIHLYRNIDFSLSLLYLRMLDKEDERYLLSGLALKYRL